MHSQVIIATLSYSKELMRAHLTHQEQPTPARHECQRRSVMLPSNLAILAGCAGGTGEGLPSRPCVCVCYETYWEECTLSSKQG